VRRLRAELRGERFLVTRDYGVGQKAELAARHDLARRDLEIEAGRGLQGPTASTCCSICAPREAKIMAKLPSCGSWRALHRRRSGTSRSDPPVVHYMMGGVDTDIRAPRRSRLYAAGETACVSMNGANRLARLAHRVLVFARARA